MLILNGITRLVFSIGDHPKGSLFLDNVRLERDDRATVRDALVTDGGDTVFPGGQGVHVATWLGRFGFDASTGDVVQTIHDPDGHDEWRAHAPGLKTLHDAFEIRPVFELLNYCSTHYSIVMTAIRE